MKTYRFLILTDHRGHSVHNSLYGLASKMAEHPACSQVAVASRGNSQNDAFFSGMQNCAIEAHIVGSELNFQATGKQFLEDTDAVRPSDFDVIFMRLPRPVSDDFLFFLTKRTDNQIIINHPKGIIETSSKAFLLNFQAYCPPLRLCYSIAEVQAFAARFPLVLKPLREYGGKGIVQLENGFVSDGKNKIEAASFFEKQKASIEKEGILAMKFLKNVKQGDKRIIVVGTEIMGASLRMPAPDSWLCNIAQGGSAIATEADADEQEIVRHIAPILNKKGILMFGLDTLVNDEGKRVISEVNTLSIGGIAPLEAQTGRPILQQVTQKIIEHVKGQQRQ